MVYLYPTEFNIYGGGSTIDVSYLLDENGVWRKTFKIHDHLGNVRSMMRDDNNLITGKFDYAPFGEPLATPGPGRLGFIDKEKDFESNLGDFGVRKYEDGIGLFTSPDPLWEAMAGWSVYAYSFNNPIHASDPSGLLAGDNFERYRHATSYYDPYDSGAKEYYAWQEIPKQCGGGELGEWAQNIADSQAGLEVFKFNEQLQNTNIVPSDATNVKSKGVIDKNLVSYIYGNYKISELFTQFTLDNASDNNETGLVYLVFTGFRVMGDATIYQVDGVDYIKLIGMSTNSVGTEVSEWLLPGSVDVQIDGNTIDHIKLKTDISNISTPNSPDLSTHYNQGGATFALPPATAGYEITLNFNFYYTRTSDGFTQLFGGVTPWHIPRH
jgi:RHS repeat-associated protein